MPWRIFDQIVASSPVQNSVPVPLPSVIVRSMACPRPGCRSGERPERESAAIHDFHRLRGRIVSGIKSTSMVSDVSSQSVDRSYGVAVAWFEVACACGEAHPDPVRQVNRRPARWKECRQSGEKLHRRIVAACRYFDILIETPRGL